MGDTTQRRRIVRGLRVLRKIFRWCRIFLWLIVLVVLVFIGYLHLVGLPAFVKNIVLKELYQYGFDANFSKMRLGWNHAIQIQDFSFGRADDPLSPSFSVAAAELKVDYFTSLLDRKFKVDSLSIMKGQCRVPLLDSNTPPLSLDHVQIEFKFLPGDRVHLENASGVFHGVALQFEGVLTNFSAIREWKVPSQTGLTNEQNWQQSLQQFADIANQITFTSPPRLSAHIEGDASDPNSIRAGLQVLAAGAKTPWGEMSRFKLIADCSRIKDPGSEPFAKLRISAARVATEWGSGNQIELKTTLRHNPAQWNLLDGAAEFSAEQPHAAWSNLASNWVRASSIKWNGAVTFAPGTNFVLYAAQGELHARNLQSPWLSIDKADMHLHTARTNSPLKADPSWGVWAFFEPYVTDWDAETLGIKAHGIDVQKLDCSGHWDAPEVTITKLNSSLYGGGLHASAHLDIISREFRIKNTLDFNPAPFGPVLGPEVEELLNQFTWQTAPKISNEGKVTLPPWTARPAGWEEQMAHSIELKGTVKAARGSYRQIDFDSGETVYVYTNQTWYLPRLHALRADGEFYMDLLSNNGTGDYDMVFDTDLDPRVLAIYLDFIPRRDEWLNRFSYSTPPKIHTHLHGNWNNSDLTGVTSQISTTNFCFFEQPISSLNVLLAYTNNVLDITNCSVRQHAQYLSAPLVRIDFAKNTLFATNCFSTLDAQWLPRIFGTNLPDFFSNIGFQSPPSVQVNGSYCFTNANAADLHFLVSGNFFRWRKMEMENIFGNVDWVGSRVRLGGVQAKLYGGGTGTGWAQFDDTATNGVDVKFQAAVASTDLAEIVHGLFGKTNQIEGKLDATIEASGNSENEKSWQGKGAVNVRDALLWNIPLFGIFSSIINAIAEDAGNSRAREASATFVINNGVLSTDDLQIQATTYRLLYRGKIDPYQINARVEAQVLRNTPVVGPIFSIVLKPLTKAFEFRISGPLDHMVTEPVYFPFPGLLSVAAHPLQSLRNLFPRPSEKTPPQEPKK